MRALFAGLFAALVACNSPETQAPDSRVTYEPEIAQAAQKIEETKAQAASNVIAIGHSFTITSKTFGEDRTVAVRLPAGYDEGKDQTYPVVYVIDGGPDQDFPHLAGIHQSRDLNWTFAPFILVGVETVDRRFEITPPHDDPEGYAEMAGSVPGGAAQFRQFLTNDVIPWVTGNYQTNGKKTVIGESLAGLFVVDTFLKQPDLFDDYISVSPSLWWNEAKITQNLKPVFDEFPEGYRRLYLTMADEGFLMQDGLDQLVDALKTNPPEGLKWTYIDRRNSEHHGSIYHPAALDAFRLLYPMAGRTGGSNKYLYKDGQMPELSADAKTSLEGECNLETAKKVTLEQKNKDMIYWNGMCVLNRLGPDRPSAGNWD